MSQLNNKEKVVFTLGLVWCPANHTPRGSRSSQVVRDTLQSRQSNTLDTGHGRQSKQDAMALLSRTVVCYDCDRVTEV